MKHILILLQFFFLYAAFGQLNDNFTDGDFTMNPIWSGDDSVYTVIDVAGNKRLRSNKLVTNSTYYLSTPSTQAQEGQWEFYTQLQFNTSSANYVDVFLTADQSNLMSTALSGYFVRIGGTTDEVSLYKKVAGTSTKIIDGADGITNTSSSQLKIKVTKTLAGDWKLERDVSGSGNTFVQEGIVNDVSLTTSSFFGISITQSTASFFQKHFFDDIYVGPIILDVTPPQLLSATAISAMQVDVLFNEPLETVSAQLLPNYLLNPFLTIQSAQLDIVNPALVHIQLWPTTVLSNGTTYELTTTAIADVNGNSSGDQTTSFTFLVADTPLPGDVILNEFMCDPSPIVGLPEVEYIELYNKSNKYFDLTGWKIGDASSFGTIQSGWLYPGEYRILCPSSNIDTFTLTVALPVTSFPSLNNAGDDIVLKDVAGNELDRLTYTDSWYKDPSKEDGGYSIELINPDDPCSDEDNWKASIATAGGTPGAVNSIWDITPDTDLPSLAELVPLAPNYLEIYFSEGMDSTLLANANYIVDPLLTLQSVFIAGAHPNMVTLQFTQNFEPSKTYQLIIENIADCWMNQTNLSGTFALPDVPVLGDVKINEILFDPYTNGYDWIEVVNTSNKLIDLQNWQLANYDNDTIDNFKTVGGHFYLKPGAYAVLGKDSTFVKQQYPFAVEGAFVYCETPSYNVDSSTVYLIANNQVMDKVAYLQDWHFKLLDNTDGVSLERIDPNGPSSESYNWHSAAQAIGFATPGGKNSQYLPALMNGDFSFSSQTVSPDNDGFEDILQVNYQLSQPGLLGTFTIYDDRGRQIRQVFHNELLGSEGTFTWDGVTEDQVKASIGAYVAVFEAFKVDGGLDFTKTKVFTVAGKL
jgi:hypothetical protein